jgi:predicted ArsR family transcriptional regulator
MTLEPKALADQIARIAILDEPLRRELYFYVSGQGGEVSRDQAARALKVSRPLAAFHLDKLVDAGLLDVNYRRLSGRSGPGAGRPSKLYRVSPQHLEVSLPQRRYELAAELLLQALEGMPAAGAHDALRDVARAWGQRLGVEARARTSRAVSSKRLFQEAVQVLSRCGFEPRRDVSGNLLLHNCPFETLTTAHRDLVCGMNVALMEGLLAGLELDDVTANLDPQPGMCCVVLRVDSRAHPDNGPQGSTTPSQH